MPKKITELWAWVSEEAPGEADAVLPGKGGAAMSMTLFVVVFEGRTGSSELMARLSQHPEIQSFPEILAPACAVDKSELERRAEITTILDCLKAGRRVESFTDMYSKVGPQFDALPVRGFKTRLNTKYDYNWYQHVGRVKNFYQVEPCLLLPMLEQRNFRLIRLGRRNLVRHAVSWLRAAHLANERGNKWNVPRGHQGLGPIRIDPDVLVHTIAWLGTARASHDAAYDAYRGEKLFIYYEDLLSTDRAHIEKLLAFLGVDAHPLAPFYDRLTDGDMSGSITNYSEISERLECWGMGQQLTDAP